MNSAELWIKCYFSSATEMGAGLIQMELLK
jgi:hypothetical protein